MNASQACCFDVHAGCPPQDGTAALAGWLQAAFDEIDYGVALVDLAACVHHANRIAREEAAAGEVFTVRGTRLHMCHADDRRNCEAALQAAGRGRRTLMETVQGRLSVAVVPLRMPSSSPSCCLVLFGRRRLSEPLTIELFAHRHGLTSTEGRVLHALCLGLKAGEAAREFGVAVSTIRTHIGSIRDKTGTQSIRDLSHRIASLPPLVPAVQPHL